MIDPIKIIEGICGVPNDLFQTSEGLKSIRMTSPNRIPYSGNIMEKYNSDEPFTSWAIATILSHKFNGSSAILKSFANMFLKPLGFDERNIINPVITAEKEGRIDVLIKEKDYCIIIENKLKGAGYQQNQLARYIKREVCVQAALSSLAFSHQRPDSRVECCGQYRPGQVSPRH